MTLANKITITRILLIPVFVLMAIYYGESVQDGEPLEWQRWCAVGIFVLAAASDGVDGYIARKYNQKTRLGVVLDPIADKGLLLSAIITLSIAHWGYRFPAWFPVLVIARDCFIVSGALLLRFLNGRVEVRPSWTGKCATAFQMVAIALVMTGIDFPIWLLPPHRSGVPHGLIDLSVWLAGFCTAVSGFWYVVGGIGQMHGDGNRGSKPTDPPSEEHSL